MSATILPVSVIELPLLEIITIGATLEDAGVAVACGKTSWGASGSGPPPELPVPPHAANRSEAAAKGSVRKAKRNSRLSLLSIKTFMNVDPRRYRAYARFTARTRADPVSRCEPALTGDSQKVLTSVIPAGKMHEWGRLQHSAAGARHTICSRVRFVRALAPETHLYAVFARSSGHWPSSRTLGRNTEVHAVEDEVERGQIRYLSRGMRRLPVPLVWAEVPPRITLARRAVVRAGLI